MKLIVENIEDVNYITEANENGTKNMYIEGVFLQSAIKNRNGRIYPEEVMDREVARYIKESVEADTAVGELGHPSGPQINLDRISHKIISLRKEGTNYIGKAKLVNTQMGQTAKNLIEGGIKLGVSSRGLGTVKTNARGINEVQSDFRLATAADIVADPSAPDAWVNGIMEGVEFLYDDKMGWKAVQIAEQAQKEIENAVRSRQLKERQLSLFENYLKRLSKSSY